VQQRECNNSPTELPLEYDFLMTPSRTDSALSADGLACSSGGPGGLQRSPCDASSAAATSAAADEWHLSSGKLGTPQLRYLCYHARTKLARVLLALLMLAIKFSTDWPRKISHLLLVEQPSSSSASGCSGGSGGSSNGSGSGALHSGPRLCIPVSVSEVHSLEMMILHAIDFNLYIDEEQFRAKAAELCACLLR
jgi:hypothetical protein